jgi:hypothetical protein
LGSEIEPHSAPSPSRPSNLKAMTGVPKDHEHIAGFVSYVVEVVVVCFLPLQLLKVEANFLFGRAVTSSQLYQRTRLKQ